MAGRNDSFPDRRARDRVERERALRDGAAERDPWGPGGDDRADRAPETVDWPYTGAPYPQSGYWGSALPRSEARTGDAQRTSAWHDARDRSDRRGFFDRAGDEIASWFGDAAAEERREQDQRPSHRGRGPKGYTRSDVRIEEDVHRMLTDDPYLDARDIVVAVKGGEVTLDGRVDTRHAKRRAEDCADGVSGVRHVQNNLRADLPDATAGSRPDIA